MNHFGWGLSLFRIHKIQDSNICGETSGDVHGKIVGEYAQSSTVTESRSVDCEEIFKIRESFMGEGDLVMIEELDGEIGSYAKFSR